MSEDILRPEGSPGAQPDLRASDADREQLVEELRSHAVAGRIDTDELEDRLQGAYAARTLGELDGLRRDLPATPEQVTLAVRERRARLLRRTIQETGGSLGLFALCTAIWISSGASGFFWPLFVIIGVLGLLVRNGWDLFGPAADFDAVEARLDGQREKRRATQELKERERRRARHSAVRRGDASLPDREHGDDLGGGGRRHR
jgi:uncharacterized protein DUF1707